MFNRWFFFDLSFYGTTVRHELGSSVKLPWVRRVSSSKLPPHNVRASAYPWMSSCCILCFLFCASISTLSDGAADHALSARGCVLHVCGCCLLLRTRSVAAPLFDSLSHVFVHVFDLRSICCTAPPPFGLLLCVVFAFSHFHKSQLIYFCVYRTVRLLAIC